MRFSTYAQWKHPGYSPLWEHMYFAYGEIENPGQYDIQTFMVPNDVGPDQWNTDDE